MKKLSKKPKAQEIEEVLSPDQEELKRLHELRKSGAEMTRAERRRLDRLREKEASRQRLQHSMGDKYREPKYSPFFKNKPYKKAMQKKMEEELVKELEKKGKTPEQIQEALDIYRGKTAIDPKDLAKHGMFAKPIGTGKTK